MMMVDTINPNTDKPDSFGGANPVSSTPVASDGENLGDGRFFSGFNQPENVKVNLASTTPGAPPQMDSFSGTPVLRPAEDLPAATPYPKNNPNSEHDAYSRPTGSDVNWRGVLVIAFLGLFISGVISGIMWFAISSSNKKQLEAKNAELTKIEGELAKVSQAPDPLELPTEVADTIPIPAPATTTPEAETPATTNTETETVTDGTQDTNASTTTPSTEAQATVPITADGSTGGTG